jgi:exosortase A-associated hydrolase 2
VRLPLHFDGGAGRTFAVAFLPRTADALHWTAGGLGVVVAPPLAEEMNKSRRTLALLGAGAASAGIPVLLPDLYGTGDSAGEFAEARWDTWCADLIAAADLLVARGAGRVALLGLRLGALLAAEAAPRCRGPVARLLLWQPVTSGRQHLAQFLRLGVASALAAGGTDTVAAIRERLARDGTVEIGGYALARDLAAAMEARELSALPVPVVPVDWLDVSADPARALPPATQAVIDGWRAAGAAVDVIQVAGDAFWATQEIAEAPALVDATLAVLQREGAGR